MTTAPDPRPGHYYVTVRDGRRTALALGPFGTHAEALERVDAVRRKCREQGGRLEFAAYGTSRLAPGLVVDPPQGRLNDVLRGDDA